MKLGPWGSSMASGKSQRVDEAIGSQTEAREPKRLNAATLKAAYTDLSRWLASDATKRAQLKKPVAGFTLWGDDGLQADVLDGGTIAFRFRYRVKGTSKREKVTIGSYPAMPLAEAYRIHREYFTQVQGGRSPAQERRDRKKRDREGVSDSETFAALANDWVSKVLRPVNKNAEQEVTYLARNILPIVGNLKPAEIDGNMCWKCFDGLRAEGYGQAARRVHSVLKRVLDYGISRGALAINPAAVIRPVHIAPTRSRKRILSPDEIQAWVQCIETSSISRPQKLALRLLMLMPVRKGELCSAKWKEIDLKGGLWDIPVENSKNGIPIRHRLTPQALEVFTQLRALAGGSDWVLPSTRKLGRIPMAGTTLNAAIRGIAGIPEDVVIHDLRRTIRTNLSELGVTTDVAELCLNHRPQGVKGIYDRSELIDQRHQALLRWEGQLARVLKVQTSGNDDLRSALASLANWSGSDEALKKFVLQMIQA